MRQRTLDQVLRIAGANNRVHGQRLLSRPRDLLTAKGAPRYNLTVSRKPYG